jgi:hypothetical protein
LLKEVCVVAAKPANGKSEPSNKANAHFINRRNLDGALGRFKENARMENR